MKIIYMNNKLKIVFTRKSALLMKTEKEDIYLFLIIIFHHHLIVIQLINQIYNVD